jgi:hypothetical protein
MEAVKSPAQARNLPAAVRGLSGRGQHLEAFYACLYYAALRPSEVGGASPLKDEVSQDRRLHR